MAETVITIRTERGGARRGLGSAEAPAGRVLQFHGCTDGCCPQPDLHVDGVASGHVLTVLGPEQVPDPGNRRAGWIQEALVEFALLHPYVPAPGAGVPW